LGKTLTLDVGTPVELARQKSRETETARPRRQAFEKHRQHSIPEHESTAGRIGLLTDVTRIEVRQSKLAGQTPGERTHVSK
jgi:hypothetical protein